MAWGTSAILFAPSLRGRLFYSNSCLSSRRFIFVFRAPRFLFATPHASGASSSLFAHADTHVRSLPFSRATRAQSQRVGAARSRRYIFLASLTSSVHSSIHNMHTRAFVVLSPWLRFRRAPIRSPRINFIPRAARLLLSFS